MEAMEEFVEAFEKGDGTARAPDKPGAPLRRLDELSKG
jgi:hypothetical protein